MSDAPHPPGLPLEMIQPWLDLLKKNPAEAQDHYFAHLLGDVLALADADPAHRRLRADGFDTLISLMGFSPETTIIAAAVVRPRRLVIVCGEAPDERGRIDSSYNRAADYLIRTGILTHAQIERRVIDPVDPVDIYDVIRTVLARTPTIDDDRSALVDVTGGKKVMSATAGQAAWEVRVPLCYVEGRYDPAIRRPRPGTERVIKLLNPSDQERVQMRISALRLYENRNFPEAVAAFETARRSRRENRLDELATVLCRAYARWTDLDLPQLAEAVRVLRGQTDEPRVRDLFREKRVPLPPFRAHFEALARVAAADPLAMIATYQELAALYRSDAFQRYDFACLLVYRGMEAVVEYGLTAAVPGFEMDRPDYARLGDPAALADGYVALSKQLDRGRGVEGALPRKVGFVNGLSLLCVAGRVTDPAGMRQKDFVGKMAEAAKLRNESVLAHGTRTLGRGEYDEMHAAADHLTRAVLGDRAADLAGLRAQLRPLDLTPLHDPNDR